MYALIFNPTLKSWSILNRETGEKHQNSYYTRKDAALAFDKINAGLIKFQPWTDKHLKHQTD
jgi:hypothetical protein